MIPAEPLSPTESAGVSAVVTFALILARDGVRELWSFLKAWLLKRDADDLRSVRKDVDTNSGAVLVIQTRIDGMETRLSDVLNREEKLMDRILGILESSMERRET